MLTSQTTVTPRSTILTTDLGSEELVLLDLASGAYYTLNETGRAIWQGINQAHSLGAISQTLMAKYEIPLEQAQPAVLVLIDELVAENLVFLCAP